MTAFCAKNLEYHENQSRKREITRVIGLRTLRKKLKKESKITKGNAHIFALKKINVFQATPRFRPHGSKY